MWSKKWCKISCDAYLLNELLETDVIHFGRLSALTRCHRGVGMETEGTVGFPE